MQVSHRVFLLPPRRELPPLRHRAIRRCRRLRRLLQPRPGARGGLRLELQQYAPLHCAHPFEKAGTVSLRVRAQNRDFPGTFPGFSRDFPGAAERPQGGDSKPPRTARQTR